MRRRTPVFSLPRALGTRCFHCGGPGKTRDHVPPKSFLLEPRPSPMTTLPSCRECNGSLGDHEQYLLRLLARYSLHPKLRRHVPRRTRKKPRPVEWDRVHRVIVKLVIGLYYRRYNAHLHPLDVTQIDAWNMKTVQSIRLHPLVIGARQPKQWDALQPGVFEFIFVNDPTGANRLHCLINLFETIGAEATCPRPTAGRIGRFSTDPSLFD